jgi:hypothetical protein
MLAFFDRLVRYYRRYAQDREIVENILKYLVSSWEGLFYHYDCLAIVRSNMIWSSLFVGLKWCIGKLWGGSGCQGYVLCLGFCCVVGDFLSEAEVLVLFRVVGEVVFGGCFVWFGVCGWVGLGGGWFWVLVVVWVLLGLSGVRCLCECLL